MKFVQFALYIVHDIADTMYGEAGTLYQTLFGGHAAFAGTVAEAHHDEVAGVGISDQVTALDADDRTHDLRDDIKILQFDIDAAHATIALVGFAVIFHGEITLFQHAQERLTICVVRGIREAQRDVEGLIHRVYAIQQGGFEEDLKIKLVGRCVHDPLGIHPVLAGQIAHQIPLVVYLDLKACQQ